MSQRRMTRYVAPLLVGAVVMLMQWGNGWAMSATETTQPIAGHAADIVETDTTLEEREQPLGERERRRVFVSADSLSTVQEDGETLRHLIGDVFVQQNETDLYSDEAIHYMDRAEYLFTGNVVVIEEGDTLRADTVRYDEREEIGHARSNVWLTDGEVDIRSPRAIHYSQENRSVFLDGVVLEDSARTLLSEEGEYFSDEERAEFVGDVRLTSPETYLESDSLTYFRATDETDARGNVSIERRGGHEDVAEEDTTARTYLFGDRARSEDDGDYSRIDGNALLLQIETDSLGMPEDTLFVRSERLDAYRSDSLRRMVAIGSARAWQRDIASVADSMVYDRIIEDDVVAREETRLFYDPFTWFEDAQVSGDRIRVAARDRSVDTVFVRDNSFAAEHEAVHDRVHQLKGRDITGYFEEDELRLLEVEHNAEAIRFLTEGDEPNGATEVSGDRILGRFTEGDLTSITVYDGIRGQYFPQADLPDPLELDGLRWRPDDKPLKSEFMDDPRVTRWLEEPPLAAQPEEEVDQIRGREESAHRFNQ